jgi:hypothetical protein
MNINTCRAPGGQVGKACAKVRGVQGDVLSWRMDGTVWVCRAMRCVKVSESKLADVHAKPFNLLLILLLYGG